MEFHFNFNKPTISKNVGEFLNLNLKSEKEKDLLNRILSGRKLQYGDANMLLNSILSSIIISDGGEEEEITVIIRDDDEDLSLSQSINPSKVLPDTKVNNVSENEKEILSIKAGTSSDLKLNKF